MRVINCFICGTSFFIEGAWANESITCPYCRAELPVIPRADPDPINSGPLLGSGRKDDAEKTRYDLLPFDILEEDAQLLSYGAVKYADRNWEKGMLWSRSAAALLRHFMAFWLHGQSLDPESGHPHLAAVRFCAAQLRRYERTHPEYDDRPKMGVKG